MRHICFDRSSYNFSGGVKTIDVDEEKSTKEKLISYI